MTLRFQVRSRQRVTGIKMRRELGEPSLTVQWFGLHVSTAVGTCSIAG